MLSLALRCYTEFRIRIRIRNLDPNPSLGADSDCQKGNPVLERQIEAIVILQTLENARESNNGDLLWQLKPLLVSPFRGGSRRDENTKSIPSIQTNESAWQ